MRRPFILLSVLLLDVGLTIILVRAFPILQENYCPLWFLIFLVVGLVTSWFLPNK